VNPGQGRRPLVLGHWHQGKKEGNEQRGDERGGAECLETAPKGGELGT
jgi:hypothetical protein